MGILSQQRFRLCTSKDEEPSLLAREDFKVQAPNKVLKDDFSARLQSRDAEKGSSMCSHEIVPSASRPSGRGAVAGGTSSSCVARSTQE